MSDPRQGAKQLAWFRGKPFWIFFSFSQRLVLKPPQFFSGFPSSRTTIGPLGRRGLLLHTRATTFVLSGTKRPKPGQGEGEDEGRGDSLSGEDKGRSLEEREERSVRGWGRETTEAGVEGDGL